MTDVGPHAPDGTTSPGPCHRCANPRFECLWQSSATSSRQMRRPPQCTSRTTRRTENITSACLQGARISYCHQACKPRCLSYKRDPRKPWQMKSPGPTQLDGLRPVARCVFKSAGDYGTQPLRLNHSVSDTLSTADTSHRTKESVGKDERHR